MKISINFSPHRQWRIAAGVQMYSPLTLPLSPAYQRGGTGRGRFVLVEKGQSASIPSQ
jgi:hypothetical protein